MERNNPKAVEAGKKIQPFVDAINQKVAKGEISAETGTKQLIELFEKTYQEMHGKQEPPKPHYGLPPSEWKTVCDNCHDGMWYGSGR